MKLNRLFNSSFFFLFSLHFVACSNHDGNIVLESNRNLVGIATPIILSTGATEVPVEDYFLLPNEIDSVAFTAGVVSLSADKQFFNFQGEASKQIGFLKVFSGDTTFSLLVKKSGKINTIFTLMDEANQFSKVQIAGDFNEWNPQLGSMEYADGKWQTSFWLAPGRYQYKYTIDGLQQTDPFNNDSIDNSVGGYNSLRWIENPSEVYPKLFTASHSGNTISIITENTTDLLVLWQNQEIMADLNPDEGLASITIPAAAKKLKRSFIRVYAMNENNTGNDLLIPLEYGEVIDSATKLDRTDWQASTLYFMMVDRFNNGDSSNDAPLNIPEVNPKADYFGGDIKGITEKIKSGYFQDLGVNSIWLSPIVQNPEGPYGLYPNPRTQFSAYHGYWPTSWSKIDYRLGDPAELKELVSLAHENNLNVLIDFVANHVHKEHWVYKQHPDWATDLYLPDGSLNTERWDEYRLTTWFDTHLPTLDLMNPELTDMLTDSAVFWIKEYDLDGFRHDATKHVPEYFWRELTKKLKKEVIIPDNKVIYQIGETYGSRELIASYVSSGQMNAQFDFSVYDDALPSFARNGVPFERLATSINESFKYYGHHHLMGNITGNQDKPRFMAYAGGDLSFTEDSKLAGWTREITVTNPVGYDKLKMFLAFNLTIPGIPVIYYGDEIGMTGANDPDNRRQMRFDLDNPEEIDVRGTVSWLTQLREQNLEFTYGDFTWLNVSDDVMAFARTYFDKMSIVAFNKGNSETTIQVELPNHFKNASLFDQTKTPIENKSGFVTLTLQPNSFNIIQTQ